MGASSGDPGFDRAVRHLIDAHRKKDRGTGANSCGLEVRLYDFPNQTDTWVTDAPVAVSVCAVGTHPEVPGEALYKIELWERGKSSRNIIESFYIGPQGIIKKS